MARATPTSHVRKPLLPVLGFLLLTVACSREPFNGPSIQPPEPRTFTVLNGWTREPVAGARVTANGTELATDPLGQVRTTITSAACVAVEVVAAGFLERRTCALSEVSLWPVADDAEREATRTMAFRNTDRMFATSELVFVALANGIGTPSAQVWRAAADELQRLWQNRITFQINHPSLDGNILVRPGPPTDCEYLLWPVDVAGFCFTGAGYDYDVLVSAERSADFAVAQRTLVAYRLHWHSMPGLINKTRPEPELSAFERKTLHMMGLRKAVSVTWPDFDDGR